jgi:hypothetical protein
MFLLSSLHTRLATGTRRTLSRIRHRAPPPDLEQINRTICELWETSCAESVKSINGVAHELASVRLWHGSQDSIFCLAR